MPIISVIIPTYNRGYCIKRTIDSVINQSFQDFEIIIIDNNSSDNTEKIINSYKDSRIKFLKIINRGIIACSRNKGIFISNSKYIAFLDSDDWWKPDKLKISLEYLEGGKDFICHELEIFRIKSKNEKKAYTENKYRLRTPSFHSFLKDGNTIQTSSVVVKRKILVSQGGFYESDILSGSEDYDMWFRISCVTNKFCIINNKLGYITFGEDNFTNESKLKKALTILIPRFEKFSSKTKYKPTYLYYFACSLYAKSGELRKFFKFLRLFFIHDERCFKKAKILIKVPFLLIQKIMKLMGFKLI